MENECNQHKSSETYLTTLYDDNIASETPDLPFQGQEHVIHTWEMAVILQTRRLMKLRQLRRCWKCLSARMRPGNLKLVMHETIWINGTAQWCWGQMAREETKLKNKKPQAMGIRMFTFSIALPVCHAEKQNLFLCAVLEERCSVALWHDTRSRDGHFSKLSAF